MFEEVWRRWKEVLAAAEERNGKEKNDEEVRVMVVRQGRKTYCC